jgi:hypothetical protein
MFDIPRYIQNQLIVVFFPIKEIRRMAMPFEERLAAIMEGLGGGYFPALVQSVPDDADPQLPRITFNSQHGFSAINISQMSIALNVSYSADWQVDAEKRTKYVTDRVAALFALAELVEDVQVLYCGFSSVVRLSSQSDDTNIIKHLSNKYIKDTTSDSSQKISGLQLSRTFIVDDIFFSNVAIGSYQEVKFNLTFPQNSATPSGVITERGIQIAADFNDKFPLTRGNNSYRSSEDQAREVVRRAIAIVQEEVARVTEP